MKYIDVKKNDLSYGRKSQGSWVLRWGTEVGGGRRWVGDGGGWGIEVGGVPSEEREGVLPRTVNWATGLEQL